MTTPIRDRRQLLLAPGAVLNGIDFIDVAPSQTELSVHFHNAVAVAGTLSGSPPVVISGGEVVTAVAVGPVNDWPARPTGAPIARADRCSG